MVSSSARVRVRAPARVRVRRRAYGGLRLGGQPLLEPQLERLRLVRVGVRVRVRVRDRDRDRDRDRVRVRARVCMRCAVSDQVGYTPRPMRSA